MKKYLFSAFLVVSFFLSKCQQATLEISSATLEKMIKNYCKKHSLDKSKVILIFHHEVQDSSIAYLTAKPEAIFFRDHIPYSYSIVGSYAVCFYDNFKTLMTAPKIAKENFYNFMLSVTGNNQFDSLIKGDLHLPPTRATEYPIWRLLIDGRDVYRLRSSREPGKAPDSSYPTVLKQYFNNSR